MYTLVGWLIRMYTLVVWLIRMYTLVVWSIEVVGRRKKRYGSRDKDAACAAVRMARRIMHDSHLR